MSQAEMILEYIERHGSISQKESVDHLGCYRLPARIYDLKAKGHKFKRVMETGINRFGVKETHARYYKQTPRSTELTFL